MKIRGVPRRCTDKTDPEKQLTNEDVIDLMIGRMSERKCRASRNREGVGKAAPATRRQARQVWRCVRPGPRRCDRPRNLQVSRLIVLETADLRGKAGALFRVELLQPLLLRSERQIRA
jgi:hypothetical protein